METTLWDAFEANADFSEMDLPEASTLFNGIERPIVIVDGPWLLKPEYVQQRAEVCHQPPFRQVYGNSY